MMTFYTVKDLKKAFPWLSAWLVNNWVKKGLVEPSFKSEGTGIPNCWTKEEALRLAVFSIIQAIPGYRKGAWNWFDRLEESLDHMGEHDKVLNIDWYIGRGGYGPFGNITIDIPLLWQRLENL